MHGARVCDYGRWAMPNDRAVWAIANHAAAPMVGARMASGHSAHRTRDGRMARPDRDWPMVPMTARASIVGDGESVGWGAAPLPHWHAPDGTYRTNGADVGWHGWPCSDNAHDGRSDPLLAPDYTAPSVGDALRTRATMARLVDSVRTFAHAARVRAQGDDTRAAYANGAADAALLVAVMAAELGAESMRD